MNGQQACPGEGRFGGVNGWSAARRRALAGADSVAVRFSEPASCGQARGQPRSRESPTARPNPAKREHGICVFVGQPERRQRGYPKNSQPVRTAGTQQHGRAIACGPAAQYFWSAPALRRWCLCRSRFPAPGAYGVRSSFPAGRRSVESAAWSRRCGLKYSQPHSAKIASHSLAAVRYPARTPPARTGNPSDPGLPSASGRPPLRRPIRCPQTRSSADEVTVTMPAGGL